MSLIMCDGFDAYRFGAATVPDSAMKWSVMSGPIAVGRRAGGYALYGQCSAKKWLDPVVSDWAMGYAFFWPGFANNDLMHAYIGGYVSPLRDWLMGVDNRGALYVQQGNVDGGLGSVIFTCTAALIANAWNYIEIKNESGLATVRVNGNTVGSGVIQEDSPCGVGFTHGLNTGNGVDDFYLISLDEETPDFLGDIAVLAYPVKVDVLKEWVPLTGSDHFAMVDEMPTDEEISYNHTDEVNKTDTFQLDPVTPLDPELQVFGVQLVVRAQKTNTASMDLVPVIQSGAVEVVGPRWGLGTGYASFIHPLVKDPNGDIDWTVENVLAANFGYRSLAPQG